MSNKLALWPYSFVESDNGILYFANGMGAMRRWDGLGSTTAELAGLAAPTAAITLAAGPSGSPATFGIVGTYYAYLRTFDRFRNFSNLSPISSGVALVRFSGTVAAVTPGTPITVTTSANHGLTSLETVYIQGCALLAANGIWQITLTGLNTFTLNDSSAPAVNFTYPAGGVWKSGVRNILYSNLPAFDTDPKVKGWQILRNTSGQTDTFYVDIESEDLDATSAISARCDTATVNGVAPLASQEAVPILDSQGRAFANRHGVPRNDKSVLAGYLDRLYAAGSREFNLGMVGVTTGSATVTAYGFQVLPPALIGRYFFVPNDNVAPGSYLITAVPQNTGTFTLAEAYKGTTRAYTEYGIRPSPEEARRVYFSEAGLPESWPATNSLALQVDGDEIVGLMPKASFLYILERRHIYRLTAQDDPGIDGFVYLAGRRGCVNNRCWVLVEDVAYMLDEDGVHAFTGQSSTPVSAPIQAVFKPASAGSPYRIHWPAREQFHAVHDPGSEVIRWFVSLSGAALPRHALCYDYRRQRWWVEEYPVPVGASCLGMLGETGQVYLGASFRKVLATGASTLDGPNPGSGTVRGTVTSAGPRTLVDSRAVFGSDLVRSPVVIVKGKGRGQRRLITAVSGTTLKLLTPWTTRPDTTSTYQVGGVVWKYQSKWLHFRPDQHEAPRRLSLLFQPTTAEATLDLKLYEDLSVDALEWGVDETSADGNGLETVKGRDYRTADLTREGGRIKARLNQYREPDSDAPEWVKVELAGVTNADQVRVKQLVFEGADG